MADDFRLDVNISQTRIYRYPFVVEGDSTRWDERMSVNILHFGEDPMACLRPAQMTEQWNDPTTIIGRRWNLTDYQTEAAGPLNPVGVTPASWVLYERTRQGDYYLTPAAGVSPSRVYSSGNYPVNRAFFIEFWVSPGLQRNQQILDFGWGEHGAVGSVGLRWTGDGRVELYKWKTLGQPPTRLAWTDSVISAGRDRRGQWAWALLLPCSRTDIMVITPEGGYRLKMDDLSADQHNIITPAGRVWWYSPHQRPYVQLTEARFLGPGYIWTYPDQLREQVKLPFPTFNGYSYADQAAPVAGSGGVPLGTVTVSLRDPANPTAPVNFTPQNVELVRLMLKLEGSSQYTPFVYAAYSGTGSTGFLMEDARTHLQSKLLRFSLKASEDPASTGGALTLKSDGTLTTGVQRRSGQSFQAAIKTTGTAFGMLAEGIWLEPTRPEKQRDLAGGFLEVRRDWRDPWKLLEDARFEEDHYPYDSWLMTDAVADLLQLGGIEVSRHDIEASTLRLDYVRPEREGKWSWKPQAGDTVAEWLRRIQETLAANWVMGFYPRTLTTVTPTLLLGQMGFRFRSKASMGIVPKASIWFHREGVFDGSKPQCFEFEETFYPVEATSITVWGYDPVTKTLLRDRWVHADAWNPTISVGARSAGWVGHAMPLTVVSQRLTRAATVTAAKEQLQAVLGVDTRGAKWTCPLLTATAGVPLWIGDCVAIRPATALLPGGNPDGGVYRITDLSFDWDRKDLGGGQGLRKVKYEGERVGNLP